MTDDIGDRLHEVERVARETAVGVERAHGDARQALKATEEFRPIVMARSGDEQRRDKYEKNTDQAHDKIREIRTDYGPRIETLEKWKERFIWIGAGILAAGQAIIYAVEKWLASMKH